MEGSDFVLSIEVHPQFILISHTGDTMIMQSADATTA